jgi:hypothetical protein
MKILKNLQQRFVECEKNRSRLLQIEPIANITPNPQKNLTAVPVTKTVVLKKTDA